MSSEPKKEDEPKKKTTRRASFKKAAEKEETAKEITVDEVMAKFEALSQEGKQAQVKKLSTDLSSYYSR
ncbi:hypothetical protein [Clostridium sp. DL1XJH146]